VFEIYSARYVVIRVSDEKLRNNHWNSLTLTSIVIPVPYWGLRIGVGQL